MKFNSRYIEIELAINVQKIVQACKWFVALLLVFLWTFLPLGNVLVIEFAGQKIPLAPSVSYVQADTVLFTETCGTNPAAILTNSTTDSGGAWSAEIILGGTNTGNINSGTSDCSASADTTNDGLGYTMGGTSLSTHEYYVRANLNEDNLSAIATTDSHGFLLNYIDTSNYYACSFNDDPSSGVMDSYILKISGGSGSTLATDSNRTGMTSGDEVECRISYSGSNPTITITNITDATQYLTVTDSSSPLTETQLAGVFCGATPARTATDDCETSLGMDNITLTDVPDPTAPTVVTSPAHPVGFNAATIWGNIDSDGNASISQHGFAFGTSSSLTGSNVSTSSLGSGSIGAFSSTTRLLTGDTAYYYRAYATNSVGTSLGSILSFTTGTSTATRLMRLFEGFRFTLNGGQRLTLYQEFIPPIECGTDSNLSFTDIGGECRAIVTSGTSFIVPTNWNNTTNYIEVIGGGAGGATNSGFSAGGGGGGGGAYSREDGITLSGTVTYAVGTGGSAEQAGGDTYLCNSTSNCASLAGSAVVVGADGGNTTTGSSGGSGGAEGNGVGTITNSGGNGGGSAGFSLGGGGGGGAGGPNGDGAIGGSTTGAGSSGGAGGGGSGGGSAGSANSGSTGGAGGNNFGGTGGGSSGGGAGSDGGGGGGESTSGDGGVGGDGTEWSSVGAGGGGGGAAGSTGGNTGGDGGAYGGGGGGANGLETGSSTGGAGGDGVIIITYTP